MSHIIKTQRLIAFTALILLVAKLIAWRLTHSVTLLTDALESIVNVVAGFIGLYTVIFAARPRDSNHPYGHGKAEFVSAAIEGTLIAITGLVIVYEAVRRLFYPGHLDQLGTGLIISIFAGLINLCIGWYAVKLGTEKRSPTLEAAGKHLLTDAWSTLCVIVGLILLMLTGWQWIDSVVALLLGVFILITGYKVLRKSIAGIMDESDRKLVQEVIQFLQENRPPKWIDLHNLRVIQHGTNIHIDAHLTIPWYYEVIDADKEIHSLENLVQSRFGDKLEMFVHVDACMPFQCNLCSLNPCPERQYPFTQQTEWNEENVWFNKKHGSTGTE
jgi:cation diffusion facilitator family transporter